MPNSKFQRVTRALRSNLGVTIVGVLEKNSLQERDKPWRHIVDIYVAPKISGTYTAREFQKLISSFDSGLGPTWKKSFGRWSQKTGLEILCFEEAIGTETVSCQTTLTDRDLFSSDGFVDGVRISEDTETIWRRTYVRFFPDIQLATEAFEGDRGMLQGVPLERPGIMASLMAWFAHALSPSRT